MRFRATFPTSFPGLLLSKTPRLLCWLSGTAGFLGTGAIVPPFQAKGALLARSVVQALPSNLSVLSLVSMAGPQHGQWGMCANGKAGLNSSLINAMSRDAGWLAFYNPIAQHRLSVANYWVR